MNRRKVVVLQLQFGVWLKQLMISYIALNSLIPKRNKDYCDMKVFVERLNP